MKPEKAANYVKNKNRSLPEYQVGPFHIFVQTPISENINVPSVFSEITNLLPDYFLNLIDVVYIGEFHFLKEREINAMYLDSAIYVSNIQDDSEDLIDDIVHEISHAVEEKYGQMLYSDEEIKNEFLLKRSKLKKILSSQEYDLSGLDFFKIEYDTDFDNFLYKEVGYDALRVLAVDLFTGPYAITSLREYFGSSFEEYYLGNRLYLKELSPYIYRKLLLLNEKDLENLEYDDGL